MTRLPPPHLPPSPPPLTGGGAGRTLARAGAVLVGAALAMFGLLLVIGTLLVGGAALVGWLLWARWQGKPAPTVVWRRTGGGPMPRGRSSDASTPADVIDVSVREVPSERPRDAD